MRLPIENAFGDVVVFGLGLGYFTYMVSEKDSVRKIRVIEKSSEVIELFRKYIMPQVKNADKIEIINEDAFVYAEKDLKNGCDYAFVDLWHDTLDGIEMYTKMKKLEKGMNTKKVDYWIEKSLLIEIRKKVFDSIYKSAKNKTNNLNFENIEFSLDLDNLKKAISNV